jgi:hypothetical protein
MRTPLPRLGLVCRFDQPMLHRPIQIPFGSFFRSGAKLGQGSLEPCKSLMSDGQLLVLGLAVQERVPHILTVL